MTSFNYRWASDRFLKGITERRPLALDRDAANNVVAETKFSFVEIGTSASFHSLGTLELILDIFMDIFPEVASYLSPRDLLRLCRVSRKLRYLLMSKQSRHIWKACRDAMEMPDCPEDLSEPQYASLIFQSYCDICASSRATKVRYAMRLKLCAKCFSLNIVKGRTVAKLFGKEFRNEKAIYILIPNFQDCRKQYTNISRQRFYMPDLYDVIKIYITVKVDPQKAKDFVESMQRRRKSILVHTGKLEEWLEQRRSTEASRILALRQAFRDRVLIRLAELGYSMDLVQNAGQMRFFTWLKLLHQKREFNEQVWEEIWPHIRAIIQGYEDYQRERTLQQLYKLRREELEKYYESFLKAMISREKLCFMPPISFLVNMPAVEDLVRRESGTRTVTKGDFDDILPHIYAAARLSEAVAEKYYSNMILAAKKQSSGIEDVFASLNLSNSHDTTDQSQLSLAIALFECKFCRNLFPYPKVLAHENSSHNCPPIEFTRSPAVHKVGHYPVILFQMIRILWKEVGFSAVQLDTVTMKSLQSMGQCFRCERCSPAMQAPMSWEGLTSHYYRENAWFERANYYTKYEPSVTVLNDHALNEIEPLASRIYDQHSDAELKIPTGRTADDTSAAVVKFACRYCLRLSSAYRKDAKSEIEMREHILAKHGKAANASDMLTLSGFAFD